MDQSNMHDIVPSRWNFRDVAFHNPLLANGLLFRGSALSLIKDGEVFDRLLKEKNIKTLIDLRADREVLEHPYPPESIAEIKYIHVPFDPWQQPDWFAKDYQQGTNPEVAYRFFTMACKPAVKKVMETIIDMGDGAAVIHCHAGKDRTGIIATMLHLLVCTPMETVYTDYLASEMDTTKDYLTIAIDIINNEGGIQEYLQSCGLSHNQLASLQKILTSGSGPYTPL